MKPIALKFGGYQEPASIHNRAACRFGDLLTRELGDRISFELIGSVLKIGRPSGDLPVMVESGEIDFCYISTARFAKWVPELKLLELPFVVKERKAICAAFMGGFGDLVRRRMRDSTSFRLLGLWDNGFRHFTNKVRPIRTPADCKGLRIRSQVSELHVEVFRAFGFEPIPVDSVAWEATAYQHQLAAAEDAEILAKLDPSMNEVIRLTDAERAAFVKASQPVLDKYRKELDPKLFAYLGA